MAGRSTASAQGRSGWEHFSHDADIGVRGFGPSIEAAFEQAALAQTAVVTIVLGSQTVKVLTHSPIPVLVFRALMFRFHRRIPKSG